MKWNENIISNNLVSLLEVFLILMQEVYRLIEIKKIKQKYRLSRLSESIIWYFYLAKIISA